MSLVFGLYWNSVELDDHPEFTREGGQHCERIRFCEEPEELSSFLEEGWGWPGAELNPDLKLRTFTRAIPRKKPPLRPAGLDRCSEATIQKWKQDQMMFPPYTYAPEYLMRETSGDRSRVASAEEREVLMGFSRGYTLALFKKAAKDDQERWVQEVGRKAAIGNSFHCGVLAMLMDLWLWSKKVRTDPLGPRYIWNKRKKEMDPAVTRLAEGSGDDGSEKAGETESEELAFGREQEVLPRVDSTFSQGDCSCSGQKVGPAVGTSISPTNGVSRQ